MKKFKINNLTITINLDNIIADIAVIILSTIVIESLLAITKLIIGLFI